MHDSLVFLIFVSATLLSIGWWVLNARKGAAPAPLLPPYTVKKSLLEPHESAYQEVLKQVVGENSLVFAKVNVTNILESPGNHPDFRVHWARLQRRSVDFLICDLNMTPMLAVKFDANPRRRRKGPKDLMEDSLDAADLPLMRVKPADSYQVEEVRFKIKYALARQDSILSEDGSILHESEFDDTEGEGASSILPRVRRWTTDLWMTARRS